MQSHCVDRLGATCALVVVFPDNTKSENPDNCGNACSCTTSVYYFRESKPTSHMPNLHTCPSFGKSQRWLGEAMPCRAIYLRGSKVPGAPFSSCGSSGGAVEGCPCTGSPDPFPESQLQDPCAVSYKCSDPKCQGAGSPVGPACQNVCPCGSTTPNPAKSACPNAMPKCSDSSCDGSPLDGVVFNGGLKLGTCSAPSADGCPC